MKFPNFLLIQRNQTLEDFTAAFEKQCEIHEHGGFLQSWLHLVNEISIHKIFTKLS